MERISAQLMFDISRWMYAIGVLGVLLLVVYHIHFENHLRALGITVYLLLILWLGRWVRFW